MAGDHAACRDDLRGVLGARALQANHEDRRGSRAGEQEGPQTLGHRPGFIAIGVGFELPVVVFYLSVTGIIEPRQFVSGLKYAVLLAFVFAAILTPPDVITQCMMAGPLMLLYEVSIVGARIFGKKKVKEDAEEPQETAG